MGHYIFKKNTVVINNFGTAVLLAEDYDYRTDKPMPYKQWWNIYFKKRGKPIISQQWEDWQGGTITVDQTDCFHHASKKLIKMLSIPENILKN